MFHLILAVVWVIPAASAPVLRTGQGTPQERAQKDREAQQKADQERAEQQRRDEQQRSQQRHEADERRREQERQRQVEQQRRDEQQRAQQQREAEDRRRQQESQPQAAQQRSAQQAGQKREGSSDQPNRAKSDAMAEPHPAGSPIPMRKPQRYGVSESDTAGAPSVIRPERPTEPDEKSQPPGGTRVPARAPDNTDGKPGDATEHHKKHDDRKRRDKQEPARPRAKSQQLPLVRPISGTPHAAQSLPQTTRKKKSQYIIFPRIDPQKVGATIPLNARATSGLPVTYASKGGCSVSSKTAHMLTPGTCTITAFQHGDVTYAAAQPVSQTVGITN